MNQTLFPLMVGLLAAPTFVSAQFSLDWFTLDGGGATSSGGAFSVSGTIGQPDAGIVSAGHSRSPADSGVSSG